MQKKNIYKDKKGVSILLSILILSSLMVITIVVSKIVLRVGKTSRQIGHSEVAYYAAESAIERILFAIEKEMDLSNLTTSGSLTEISDAGWGVEIALEENNNPWQINLAAGESFQLDLNTDGLNYPTSIDIDWSSADVSAIVVDPDNSVSPFISYNSSFTLNNISTDLPVLRIINSGSSSVSVELSSSGTLPSSIIITATGNYLTEERKIEVERDLYQIY